jgi:V8-like Glu-specific endopeptidase
MNLAGSTLRGLLLRVPYVLLMLGAGNAAATLYCGRPYTELKQNPGKPYNAVGFLSNGCTASLIDANHILAAGHCFVDGVGAWQPELRFYPNFHPGRVTADEKHVPLGQVARAVVGARVAGSMGDGADWGIARIDGWQDTAGLDLTPLALATSVPAADTALVNPAYTRHHFPYDDHDAATWDNMEWDTKYCGWVGETAAGKNDGGMWAIRMHTAPIHDGVHRDRVGCNSRWGAGMIHANCSLTKVAGDVIVHNCDTVGGSSGSPILYKDTSGTWKLIGVGHGGGLADFSLKTPVCTNDTPDRRDNVGPSVERFRHAPRFASSIAVHRRPDNAAATAVFAVDGDSNQVVYRTRTGPNPTYKGNFGFWQSLGTPYRGSKLTRIAACSATASGRPQVFVVADKSNIYTRSALQSGRWGSWSKFGIAAARSGVVDIDAASDASGRCQLFMVANGGSAFTRTKTSDTTWASWSMVASGAYQTVTALNYDGVLWVAMLDKAGEVWRTSRAPSGWTVPAKVARPPGVNAWRDIDMTWDEAARGFMLATPAGGGDRLWFMPMYGGQAWAQWRYFETHLWAPGAQPQPAPHLESITASRWMEDPSGTTSPVVFATDVQGNVYLIEYARVGIPGWVLDWKSFYHETIPYG